MKTTQGSDPREGRGEPATILSMFSPDRSLLGPWLGQLSPGKGEVQGWGWPRDGASGHPRPSPFASYFPAPWLSSQPSSASAAAAPARRRRVSNASSVPASGPRSSDSGAGPVRQGPAFKGHKCPLACQGHFRTAEGWVPGALKVRDHSLVSLAPPERLAAPSDRQWALKIPRGRQDLPVTSVSPVLRKL